MPTYNVNGYVGEDDVGRVYPCDMSDLPTRIRAARRDKKLTQNALAKALGINRVSVTQWELGETQPATERIDELARILNVTTDWLLTGREAASDRKGSLTREIAISGAVPVTGYVEAGRWFDIDDDHTAPLGMEVPAVGGYPLHLQRALIVSGNSINRVARPGDMLICLDHIGAGQDIIPGDLVIVERSRFGGQMIERTAKRIRRSASGAWELWPESDDPAFQSPAVFESADEHEDIRIAAKVLWVIRRP